MNATTAANTTVADKSAWYVVLLAALTQAINQIDKAVLSFAAEPIMAELDLTPAEYGVVAGALYMLFAVGGLVIAFFAAPRFTPRNILIALLAVWSLTQLPIVFAASLAVLVVCRVILGAAEGGGIATCMNVTHEWFSDRRRELPSALIQVGGTVGTLLAAPALTYVIAFHGWRSAFLACGMFGALIMFGWLLVRGSGPHAATVQSEPISRKSLGRLLRIMADPTILGLILVGFCSYWSVGFMVAWLAPYVRIQAGFTLEESGWILSLVYLGQSLILLGIAFVSRRLLAAGHSSRIARAFVMAAIMAGGAACYVALGFVSDPMARLVLMTLAVTLPGGVFPLIASTISEVAPPEERYRLMTIVMALVTLSALVSPGIAGAMIDLDSPNGWQGALSLIAAVVAVGAVVAVTMLHPARTLERFAANSGSRGVA